MKCLILAAGYATRLYPLTENFPKPLLKVGEKSILDWLVDDLVETTDIDEFVVISNHKFWLCRRGQAANRQTAFDDARQTNFQAVLARTSSSCKICTKSRRFSGF